MPSTTTPTPPPSPPENPKSSSSSSSSSPFHKILISSPNQKSAHAALHGPLSSPPTNTTTTTTTTTHPQILSTYDPYNARMGSGGGTLAAISHANTTTTTTKTNNEQQSQSILVIHAGGESSRCPTQMCLGKAWTTLPLLVQPPNEVDEEEGGGRLHHPTGLLIAALEVLLRDLPKGSIVVAASDVLLSLPVHDEQQHAIQFDDITTDNSQGRVIGLAVPAPLHTAQNHGVFVVPPPSSEQPHNAQEDTDESNNINNNGIQSVHKFLQKPTIETMQSIPGGTFPFSSHNNNNIDEGGGAAAAATTDMAWIDTGVVIFLPTAAQQLRSLCHGALQVCTEVGLNNLYKKEKKQEDSKEVVESMEEFAKRVTVKVDLYSHILQALSTNGDSSSSSTSTTKEQLAAAAKKRKQDYLATHHTKSVGLPTDILESIYTALSDLELKVLTIPLGQFVHLGTTNELRNFLIEGVCYNNNSTTTNDTNLKHKKDDEEGEKEVTDLETRLCRQFGKQIGLTNRSKTFLNGVTVHPTSVICNSIISVSLTTAKGSVANVQNATRSRHPSTIRSDIGAGTVMEHCHLTLDPYCKISIGSNCLISGLRGHSSATTMSIPNNMMFQMVPLETADNDDEITTTMKEEEEDQQRYYVYTYLSIDDAIKKRDTCYGVQFDELLKWTGMRADDLWDDDGTPQLLWTARIHPVMMAGDTIDWGPISWITDLITSDDHHRGSQIHATMSSSSNSKVKVSFEQWKALRRLSLSEIRNMADTSTEFTYRHLISTQHISSSLTLWLNHLQRILDERRHESFDFCFITDEIRHQIAPQKSFFLTQTLQALDSTITSNIENGRYDISSRSFMLMGNLLTSIATIWIDKKYSAAEGQIKQKRDVISNERNLDVLRSWASTSDDKILACRQLFDERDGLMDTMINNGYSLSVSAAGAEKAAFALTELCVSNPGATDCSKSTAVHTHCSTPSDTWTIATAPARIDLSGGWSDTPPISYEFGGAVACLAVTIDGKRPLSARCRKLPNRQGIILRTESRDSLTGELIGSDSVKIDSVEDLADFRDPLAKCALLKCAFICTGLVPIDIFGTKNTSLQPFIQSFCKQNGSSNIGLELISTSLLPRGSGMGASSILAGCVLVAISHCVNNNNASTDLSLSPLEKEEESNSLVQRVLFLEQLLSTGGGWQDQVGGIFGGLKLGLSSAHKVPLQIKINRIALTPKIETRLNDRLLLAFTGKPRLAKNILQNVLRQWARRSPDIVQNVHSLVAGAHDVVKVIQQGDLDALGKQLSLYWGQKKLMAGLDSGVEPVVVNQVISHLQGLNIITGGTLVGAGGGGFMALFLQEGKTAENVKESLKTSEKLKEDTKIFTWHQCSIDTEGLTVVDMRQEQHTSNLTDFNLQWHIS